MPVTTVFGPPGTGKTTYLARQIERAVEKFGPDRVIVCSLTTTAATEIISRGLSVTPAHVGTLHAICYRSLGRPKLFDTTVQAFNDEMGFKLSPNGDTNIDSRAARVLSDDLECFLARTDSDDAVRSAIDLWRMKLLPVDAMPVGYVRLWNAMEAWKSSHNVIDFTDMILLALERFQEHPARPRVIVYDEAQDGSAAELALIKQWSTNTDHSIIAGDDDQCIFGFRGSDVNAFLSMSDAEHQKVLDTTHRLPHKIYSYAERWVHQIGVRKEKSYRPRDDAEDGEIIILPMDPTHLPILKRVSMLPPGETMMILATCGYLLQPIIRELRKRFYPYANPFRENRGDWNPLARGKRVVKAVDRVIAYAQSCPELVDDPRPQTWKSFHAWTEHFEASKIESGAKAFISKKYKEIPDAVVSIPEIGSLLGPAVTTDFLSGNFSPLLNCTLKTGLRSLDYPVRVAMRHGMKALLEPPRVFVGTVHSCKGAEADEVILLPDLSRQAAEAYRSAGSEGRDAVLRVFYVGVTRAKKRLVLCLGGSSPDKVQWIRPAPEGVPEAPF